MTFKKILSVVLTVLLLLSLVSCDSEDEVSYVICPNCEKKCDTYSAFCNKCGSSLENAEFVIENNNKNNGNNNSYNENDDDDDWEDEYANVDCYECYDAGYDSCQGHDCLWCDGEGSYACYGCEGSGLFMGMTCYGCDGEGVMECLTCDSTGTIYHKFTELPDYVETTPSYERTEKECDKCEKGKITCPLCEGTGRFGTGSAPSYSGNTGNYTYEKTCSQCHGAKKIKCNTCGGDGIC